MSLSCVAESMNSDNYCNFSCKKMNALYAYPFSDLSLISNGLFSIFFFIFNRKCNSNYYCLKNILVRSLGITLDQILNQMNDTNHKIV